MINPTFTNLVTVALLITFGAMTSTNAQFRSDRPTFFRNGYEQMQREIQRLQSEQQQTPTQQIEHPSQLLTIDQGQLSWQKFIFRDAGFSVWMPQAIQSEETVNLDTKSGNISFEVFATHPQTLRYVAAYSQILDQTQLNNPQTLLDAVRDGIIAKTKYQLINDQSISWKNYPGILLSMETKEEMITFKVYLIGKRVYILGASQEQTRAIDQNVLDFFDSFRLLN